MLTANGFNQRELQWLRNAQKQNTMGAHHPRTFSYGRWQQCALATCTTPRRALITGQFNGTQANFGVNHKKRDSELMWYPDS